MRDAGVRASEVAIQLIGLHQAAGLVNPLLKTTRNRGVKYILSFEEGVKAIGVENFRP